MELKIVPGKDLLNEGLGISKERREEMVKYMKKTTSEIFGEMFHKKMNGEEADMSDTEIFKEIAKEARTSEELLFLTAIMMDFLYAIGARKKAYFPGHLTFMNQLATKPGEGLEIYVPKPDAEMLHEALGMTDERTDYLRDALKAVMAKAAMSPKEYTFAVLIKEVAQHCRTLEDLIYVIDTHANFMWEVGGRTKGEFFSVDSDEEENKTDHNFWTS